MTESKKLYLTDQQMTYCALKEGDIVHVGNDRAEIARIIPFEEMYPPPPSPYAKCSNSKLF